MIVVSRGSRRQAALTLLVALALGCVLGCAGGGVGGAVLETGEPARRFSVPRGEDGDLLVVLRSPLDRPTTQVVQRLARSYQLTPRASWPMKSILRECVVFDSIGRFDPALLRRLEGDPSVEMVQTNATFEVRGAQLRGAGARVATTQEDPHADLQYAHRVMGLDAAHRRATGRGVRIGIIDTGAELDHPDLRGQVVEAKNLVRGDQSFMTDRHGTAVAGVIAAAGGNGVGIVGVAPDARLHLLKACWYPRRRFASEEGSEQRAVCSSYTLALALDHAVDARYQVVNLSLGGPADALLERIVRAGVERNMVFVAPAPEQPGDGLLAGLEAVLRVLPLPDEGAAPRAGDTADLPDGDLLQQSVSVGLSAPGTEVLTTVPGAGFDFVSGSSIASAHVAGVVALLLEGRDSAASRGGLRLGELLRRTSRPFGDRRVPAVDACRALAALDAGALGSPGRERAFTLDCEDAAVGSPEDPPSSDSPLLHR